MKLFLIVTGLIFLAIGVRGLLDPVAAVGNLFGMKFEGRNGMNQMRATAGGVTIAAGAVMLSIIMIDWIALPALILCTTILGGLFVGRLYSLAVDGKPSAVVWISGAFEVFGLVQAAYWLAQALPGGVA